jgi:hypothetical protein
VKPIRYTYVAGPISIGDQIANCRAALDAGEQLRRGGYAPFVPHSLVLWHLLHLVPYEAWLEYDFAWISRCDALVRLPGESLGADREVAHARLCGLPVFFGVEAFLRDAPHAGTELDARTLPLPFAEALAAAEGT